VKPLADEEQILRDGDMERAFRESGVPEGYHLEWCADENWKVGGDGRQCRRTFCNNPAVAALKRIHAHGFRWWHYCELHLYGRKIENGVVKFRRLVENAGTGSGTVRVAEKTGAEAV